MLTPDGNLMPCTVTREALAVLAGGQDPATAAEMRNLFRANRNLIEKMASDLYDRGELERGVVTVRSKHVKP